MKKLSLLFIVFLIISFASCGYEGAEQQNTKKWTQSKEKQKALAQIDTVSSEAVLVFNTCDLSGQHIDETIFNGNELTMINIWATFCGPCLQEMPELGELSAECTDSGVQVIGIVVDIGQNVDGTFDQKQVDNAKSLVAQTGANYLHLLPSEDLYAAKLSQVSAVPETIFVDANGKQIGESYIGSRSKAEWTDIIEQLLAQVE